MLVPVVALVVALLIPVQNAGIGGCEDVHIIGVRGSGQTDYGEPVGSVVTGTAASVRRTGRSVIAHSLDYPAISISDSFGFALLNGDYSRSVAAGVEALRSDLDTIRNLCPDTQVVLVGYSQGSQVIKNTAVDRPPVDRIAAVVLLADPTRDVTQPGIVRLGSGLDGSGAFGSITLPDHLRTVAIDVCAVGDGVCGTGGFLSHIDGYEEFAPPIVLHILSELAASPLRYLRAA
jgi:pimeloyl-ACP methyl ester carboxylesterase